MGTKSKDPSLGTMAGAIPAFLFSCIRSLEQSKAKRRKSLRLFASAPRFIRVFSPVFTCDAVPDNHCILQHKEVSQGGEVFFCLFFFWLNLELKAPSLTDSEATIAKEVKPSRGLKTISVSIQKLLFFHRRRSRCGR